MAATGRRGAADPLPIAGCGLAVSMVAGLSDRRRLFALLRLTGAPLRDAVGLVVSLGIIASTLPLLKRVTGPENRPQRLTPRLLAAAARP